MVIGIAKFGSNRFFDYLSIVHIILLKFILVGLIFNSVVYADHAPVLRNVLRVGVLPDSAKNIIESRYDPLIRYFRQEVGIELQLVISKNYQNQLELFKNKAVDLAVFGGYMFVKAQQEAGAEPLVMRDTDLRFSSVFLVRSDDNKHTIEEFKGARIGFGSKLSTSGYVMPLYFLSERKIAPDSFFSEVLFSGSHDNTAYWVRDGKVDLGAASKDVIGKMYRDGLISEKDVRVLWETPFYTDYVWAVRSDFDSELRDRLLDAFLSLSPLNPEHQKVLVALGAGGFLPVNKSDFALLRKIVTSVDAELP